MQSQIIIKTQNEAIEVFLSEFKTGSPWCLSCKQGCSVPCKNIMREYQRRIGFLPVEVKTRKDTVCDKCHKIILKNTKSIVKRWLDNLQWQSKRFCSHECLEAY